MAGEDFVALLSHVSDFSFSRSDRGLNFEGIVRIFGIGVFGIFAVVGVRGDDGDVVTSVGGAVPSDFDGSPGDDGLGSFEGDDWFGELDGATCQDFASLSAHVAEFGFAGFKWSLDAKAVFGISGVAVSSILTVGCVSGDDGDVVSLIGWAIPGDFDGGAGDDGCRSV